MDLTRRQLLVMGTSAIALIGASAIPSYASIADDAIADLTGGADLGEGVISLTAPEIAENGNNVPVSFDAPGAIEVTLFADGNPVPKIAGFNFGPLSGSRFASTRVRLSTTQNVIAIAKMEDGSYQMAKTEVKVTIGGCGG